MLGVKTIDRSLLEEEQRPRSKSTKKGKKEKKKHKREKKKEYEGERSEGLRGSSDDNGVPRGGTEDEESAPLSVPSKEPAPGDEAPVLVREDWMTQRMPRSVPPVSEALPAVASVVEIVTKAPAPQVCMPPPGPTGSVTPVGDGGASWRLKALRRAQQRAREEGRDLKEVLEERLGDAAALAATVPKAQPAHDLAHLRAARERQSAKRSGEGHPPREPVPHYLEGLNSRQGQMRRPDRDASLSWRSAEGHRRDRRPDSGAKQEEVDKRSRESDVDKRDEGDRGGEPPATDGAPSAREDDKTLDREEPRGRDRVQKSRNETNRTRGGGGEEDGQLVASVSQSEPHAGGRHEHRGSGSRKGRGSYGRGRELREEDRQLLTSVAQTISTFKNDGSFLAQFQSHEAGGGGKGRSDDGDVAGAESPPQDPTPVGDRGPGRAIPLPRGAGVNNSSVAAALRARLMGRGGASTTETPQNLEGVTAGAGGSGDSEADTGPGRKREVVVLPSVDSAGRAVPGAFGRESAVQEPLGRKSKRPIERYDDSGHRARYFADDDKLSLQDMVKKIKYGDDDMDLDGAVARNIAQSSRFKTAELDADAEYDYDGGLELYQKARHKGDKDRQQRQEHARQVRDYQRLRQAEERCVYCNSKMRQPLTVAIGQTTLLMMIPKGRLTDGHCVIVPGEHTPSMRQVDEHVWTEVRNFQKCLIQMFMKEDKEIIFMETAMDLSSKKGHAAFECIPMSREVMHKAPIYFKKAIEDSESEWSQHHAKRLIDTSSKGLRGSVPVNFPYFYVQFGYGRGYVHVIDDERKFDRELGRKVLGGLLKLPPEELHGRLRGDSLQEQERRTGQFRQQFDPFDWTKQLED